MQIYHIIFESDSQVVVQTIHANKGGTSEFSLIIFCIKNLLVCNFNFKVKFAKHQTNMVAHFLAKADNSWFMRHVFHLIPPCIEQQLFNDKS